MDKPVKRTAARADAATQGIKAGKISMRQRADGAIVVSHEKRPTIEIEVLPHMLEAWVLRQLREGVFS